MRVSSLFWIFLCGIMIALYLLKGWQVFIWGSFLVAIITGIILLLSFHESRKEKRLKEYLESRLGVPTDLIRMISSSDESRIYLCGHKGPAHYSMDVYGTRLDLGNKDVLCPDCCATYFEKETIHCARCGHAILPGEPVTALHRSSTLPFITKGTVYKHDSYLTCTAWDCCDTLGALVGTWDGRKVLPLFKDGKTPMQIAFETGQPAIIKI